MEPPRKLQEEYRRVAMRAVQDEAELRRLAPPLREAGVEVLLIKGAALKGLIYPNPGLRPADDSDWVVHSPGDWEEACRVLAREGYQGAEGEGGAAWERGESVVELHRNVLGDERVLARLPAADEAETDAAVWARSHPSPLGPPFRVPAPGDHLIILCTHLMKHNFEPGIWFTDIEGLLLSEPGLDWEAVLSRARAWGLARPLAYALRSLGLLGEGRFGAPALALPPGVRAALAEMRPSFLERLLLSLAHTRLSGEKEEWERPPVGNLLWLSSRQGAGAKLALLREAAFPRHEVMAQIYPGYRPALRGWYLLRRGADLLRLALRLAARLGRRS